jgi:cytoskeletal protein RodZ
MDSLGTFFREAREAKGLTLEQVGASTRIQESYLKAIEEEHFHVLPQKVFAKGFVRTYAQTLGLDEEEAMQRFSAAAGSYYLKEEEEHQQIIQREEEDRKGKANRNAVIILTGVILVGLVFILPGEQSPSPTLSKEQQSKTASNFSTPHADSITELADQPEEGQEVFPDAQNPTSSLNGEKVPFPVSPVSKTVTPASGRTQPDLEPVKVVKEAPVATPVEQVRTMRSPFELGMGEQDGPLMLELEALEITWVVVRSDDREPHEALLQPGARALWRAHERFFLTLGNAGGVKVTLNGEPRGPFGELGTVIRDLEIKP